MADLRRRDLDADPIVQFQRWFEQAARERKDADLGDVNAATLATADREGRPSARIVLLKGVDARGFIFFTNYDSRKAREIAENPNVSLVVYWPDQERQVSIAGRAAKIPRAESEAYFKSRPRGSRLAAWASRQFSFMAGRVSRVLAGR